MAMKDLFELSSVLQGDDHEKNELERKKMLLTSAIKQQEDRVLEDLFDTKIAVNQEYEEVLDSIEKEADKVDCTLHQGTIFKEMLATFPLETITNNFAAFAHAVQDFRNDIQAVKAKLSKMETDLERAQAIDMLASSKDLAEIRSEAAESSTQIQELERETEAMANQESDIDERALQVAKTIEEVIAHKSVISEEFRAAFVRLAQLESELKIEQQLTKDLTDSLEKERASWQDEDSKTGGQQEELVKAKKDQLDQMRLLSAQEAELRGSLARIEQEIDQNKTKSSIRESEIKSSQAEAVEIEREVGLRRQQLSEKESHLHMLRCQRDANLKCSFSDKLQQLQEETESARSLHQEIREKIQVALQQLNPSSGSESVLSEAIKLMNASAEKKETLLQNLQACNDSVRSCLDDQKRLSEQATFSVGQSNILRARLHEIASQVMTAAAEVSDKKSILNNQSLHHNVAENSILSGKLDDEISLLQLKVLEKEQTLAQLLIQRKQLENSRKLQAEEARLSIINQEKSARLMKLKMERINLHKETIHEIEEALMKEDEIFQRNVTAAEDMLKAKKEQLAAELEDLLSLPAEDKKVPKQQRPKEPLLNEVNMENLEPPHRKERSVPSKRKAPTKPDEERKQPQAPFVVDSSKKPRAKMRAGLSISSWHPNK